MKNKIKLFGIIVLVAVIGFSMIACNKGGSSAPSASGGSASTSGSSLDRIIDDYEKIITDFNTAMQKVMGGDLSAAGELGTVQGKLEDIMKEIEQNQNQFTPAQIERLARIVDRL